MTVQEALNRIGITSFIWIKANAFKNVRQYSKGSLLFELIRLRAFAAINYSISNWQGYYVTSYENIKTKNSLSHKRRNSGINF